MHRDTMDALSDLGFRVGNVLRMQTLVARIPTLAAVIGPDRAGRRDRDEHSLWILRIDRNCVETHSARARLPFRPGVVSAETWKLVPRFAAVFRLKQGRVFDSRVNMIGVIE